MRTARRTLIGIGALIGLVIVAIDETFLPVHYGRGLLEIYAVIWAAAALAGALRHWRRRSLTKVNLEANVNPEVNGGAGR